MLDIDANAWIEPVLGLVGVILMVIGGAIGSSLTFKVSKRTAENTTENNKKSAENALIDQLQEELLRYRTANDERSTAQDVRMTLLEVTNQEISRERDVLRDYAHQLRSDIYNGAEPPPAAWPAGIFK